MINFTLEPSQYVLNQAAPTAKRPPEVPRARGSEILTVAEAAALLRINRKTLYEQIQRERPVWAMRCGTRIRISRIALLAAFRGGRT